MRTCNPLSVDELGRSAALALMGYEPSVLPSDEHFNHTRREEDREDILADLEAHRTGRGTP